MAFQCFRESVLKSFLDWLNMLLIRERPDTCWKFQTIAKTKAFAGEQWRGTSLQKKTDLTHPEKKLLKDFVCVTPLTLCVWWEGRACTTFWHGTFLPDDERTAYTKGDGKRSRLRSEWGASSHFFCTDKMAHVGSTWRINSRWLSESRFDDARFIFSPLRNVYQARTFKSIAMVSDG